MKKNILVTGGAGYIGAHACKALSKAGFTPIVYDNLSTGHASAVKWGPLIKGDLNDCRPLAEIFANTQIEAVMHFAAFSNVPLSISNPLDVYKINLVGFLNLLELMLRYNVKKIIFSSSCSVYGITNRLISEQHSLNPVTPYGMSKMLAERILKEFGSAYGIRSLALRYFNAAGADPECEIGEHHDPETHLIPRVLNVAMGGEPFLTIYGNDFSTKDGTAIRDYIHVSDIAHAHVLAMSKLDQEKQIDAVNLGSGKGFSVNEIVESVRKITGAEISVSYSSRRSGDPDTLVADNYLAQQYLGWCADDSSLDVIINTAWKWHKFLNELKKLPTT